MQLKNDFIRRQIHKMILHLTIFHETDNFVKFDEPPYYSKCSIAIPLEHPF